MNKNSLGVSRKASNVKLKTVLHCVLKLSEKKLKNVDSAHNHFQQKLNFFIALSEIRIYLTRLYLTFKVHSMNNIENKSKTLNQISKIKTKNKFLNKYLNIIEKFDPFVMNSEFRRIFHNENKSNRSFLNANKSFLDKNRFSRQNYDFELPKQVSFKNLTFRFYGEIDRNQLIKIVFSEHRAIFVFKNYSLSIKSNLKGNIFLQDLRIKWPKDSPKPPQDLMKKFMSKIYLEKNNEIIFPKISQIIKTVDSLHSTGLFLAIDQEITSFSNIYFFRREVEGATVKYIFGEFYSPVNILKLFIDRNNHIILQATTISDKPPEIPYGQNMMKDSYSRHDHKTFKDHIYSRLIFGEIVEKRTNISSLLEEFKNQMIYSRLKRAYDITIQIMRSSEMNRVSSQLVVSRRHFQFDGSDLHNHNHHHSNIYANNHSNQNHSSIHNPGHNHDHNPNNHNHDHNPNNHNPNNHNPNNQNPNIHNPNNHNPDIHNPNNHNPNKLNNKDNLNNGLNNGVSNSHNNDNNNRQSGSSSVSNVAMYIEVFSYMWGTLRIVIDYSSGEILCTPDSRFPMSLLSLQECLNSGEFLHFDVMGEIMLRSGFALGLKVLFGPHSLSYSLPDLMPIKIYSLPCRREELNRFLYTLNLSYSDYFFLQVKSYDNHPLFAIRSQDGRHNIPMNQILEMENINLPYFMRSIVRSLYTLKIQIIQKEIERHLEELGCHCRTIHQYAMTINFQTNLSAILKTKVNGFWSLTFMKSNLLSTAPGDFVIYGNDFSGRFSLRIVEFVKCISSIINLQRHARGISPGMQPVVSSFAQFNDLNILILFNNNKHRAFIGMTPLVVQTISKFKRIYKVSSITPPIIVSNMSKGIPLEFFTFREGKLAALGRLPFKFFLTNCIIILTEFYYKFISKDWDIFMMSHEHSFTVVYKPTKFTMSINVMKNNVIAVAIPPNLPSCLYENALRRHNFPKLIQSRKLNCFVVKVEQSKFTELRNAIEEYSPFVDFLMKNDLVLDQQTQQQLKHQRIQLLKQQPQIQQTQHIQSPSLQIQSPSLQIQSPSLQIQSPSLQIQSPSLQIQSPSLQIQSPEIQQQQQISQQQNLQQDLQQGSIVLNWRKLYSVAYVNVTVNGFNLMGISFSKGNSCDNASPNSFDEGTENYHNANNNCGNEISHFFLHDENFDLTKKMISFLESCFQLNKKFHANISQMMKELSARSWMGNAEWKVFVESAVSSQPQIEAEVQILRGQKNIKNRFSIGSETTGMGIKNESKTIELKTGSSFGMKVVFNYKEFHYSTTFPYANYCSNFDALLSCIPK